MTNNGWNEHAKLVMHEIDRLDACVQAVEKKQEKMNVDIAIMKVKWAMVAGAVGFFAGLIPVLFKLIFR